MKDARGTEIEVGCAVAVSGREIHIGVLYNITDNNDYEVRDLKALLEDYKQNSELYHESAPVYYRQRLANISKNYRVRLQNGHRIRVKNVKRLVVL